MFFIRIFGGNFRFYSKQKKLCNLFCAHIVLQSDKAALLHKLIEVKTMDKQTYISELYRLYSDKVYAVCMKYLHNGDDAQDIMHDTYITAINKIGGLKNPKKAEKWLCAVAANKCKDYIKKNKPMYDSESYEYENAATQENPTENAVIDESVQNELREIVNSLPSSQKNVIAGFYFESKSVKQLANALSCTQNSVKVTLHRARKAIKSQCEQRGITLSGCALGSALAMAAKGAGVKFAASTAAGFGIAAKIASCVAAAAIVVYGAIGVANYSGIEIGSVLSGGNAVSGESNFGEFSYQCYGPDNKSIEIVEYMGSAETVVFPSEINGAPVKSLGGDTGLFAHPDKVKKVLIPSGVENISGEFSGCENLSEIVLPDTLNSISEYVFCDTAYYKNDENWENGVLYIGNYLIDGKKQLKTSQKDEYGDFIYTIERRANGDITVKNGTLCIADSAFYECDTVTSVYLPDSVKYIGMSAFSQCFNLNEARLSENLEELCFCLFEDCESLNSITLPKSITRIDSSAFERTGIYNNEKNWENGALYIDDVLIDVNGDISSEYTVKDGTRIIAGDAFIYSEVTKITIPDSVKYICDGAFYGCEKLKSVRLPNSLKLLGAGAFQLCTNLTSITIPGNIKTIYENTFYSCRKLSDITIENGVENIYGGAFINCKLSEVFIPDSVKYIGAEALGYKYDGTGGDNEEPAIAEPKLTIICSEDSAAYKYAKEFKVDVKIV